MGPNFFGLRALAEHMEDSFGFKTTCITDWVLSHLPMEQVHFCRQDILTGFPTKNLTLFGALAFHNFCQKCFMIEESELSPLSFFSPLLAYALFTLNFPLAAADHTSLLAGSNVLTGCSVWSQPHAPGRHPGSDQLSTLHFLHQ